MSKGQRKRNAQKRAARVAERDRREAALKANDAWRDKQKAKRGRAQAETGPHSVEEFRDALRLSDYVIHIGDRNIHWEVPHDFLSAAMPLEQSQSYGDAIYSVSNYSVGIFFESWKNKVEIKIKTKY